MTVTEALDIVEKVRADLRPKHYPNESKDQPQGALGFDYGYQTALNTMSIALMGEFMKVASKEPAR